jgi:hypothetical protein
VADADADADADGFAGDDDAGVLDDEQAGRTPTSSATTALTARVILDRPITVRAVSGVLLSRRT